MWVTPAFNVDFDSINSVNLALVCSGISIFSDLFSFFLNIADIYWIQLDCHNCHIHNNLNILPERNVRDVIQKCMYISGLKCSRLCVSSRLIIYSDMFTFVLYCVNLFFRICICVYVYINTNICLYMWQV